MGGWRSRETVLLLTTYEASTWELLEFLPTGGHWRPLARTIYELYDLLILLAVFPSLFGSRTAAGGGSRHLLFHNHHRTGRRVCGRRTIAAALHGSIHR